MSQTVIQVQDVSKQYRLGQVGRRALNQDINRWLHRIQGKEDPYLKIGEENNRSTKGSSDYVWALQNINFSVQQGEVLGIIGRNGAGKSTLLKLLSKVTGPTTGQIKIRGKIASLLEVGTGFHPDLSGRENIFLNGAILGMTRMEIQKNFDAIVDFAGVERYIDTPVKRYSSGMYVRLAFAVAAHLEPDILIVDEVLAVGDAEFQKKCLGKMKDVSVNDGRTVLFVSHNMTAVQSLCKSVLMLENGKFANKGETKEIIDFYLKKIIRNELEKAWTSINDAPGNEVVRIKKIKVLPAYRIGDRRITVETPLKVEFEFWSSTESLSFNLSMHVFNSSDDLVFASASPVYTMNGKLAHVICEIPGNLLNDGGYYISMMIVNNSKPLFFLKEAVSFEIEDVERAIGWLGKWPGFVRPSLVWDILN